MLGLGLVSDERLHHGALGSPRFLCNLCQKRLGLICESKTCWLLFCHQGECSARCTTNARAMLGTIHSMFAYPNIAQSQVDNLKQQMPCWGFTVTPSSNPNVFSVSGHGVSGQVLYDPKEMF